MINPSELNVKDQVFKQNKGLVVKEILNTEGVLGPLDKKPGSLKKTTASYPSED